MANDARAQAELGEFLYLNGAKASREGCIRGAELVLRRTDWTVESLASHLYVAGLVANKASAPDVAERALRWLRRG